LSRVTLVWVSEKTSFCRMFSLPKPLVYVTIFGLFFFLCTSVTILVWTQGSYEQIIVQQEQNRALGNRLTEQDLLLEFAGFLG
jgi:hypothetical protein